MSIRHSNGGAPHVVVSFTSSTASNGWLGRHASRLPVPTCSPSQAPPRSLSCPLDAPSTPRSLAAPSTPYTTFGVPAVAAEQPGGSRSTPPDCGACTAPSAAPPRSRCRSNPAAGRRACLPRSSSASRQGSSCASASFNTSAARRCPNSPLGASARSAAAAVGIASRAAWWGSDATPPPGPPHNADSGSRRAAGGPAPASAARQSLARTRTAASHPQASGWPAGGAATPAAVPAGSVVAPVDGSATFCCTKRGALTAAPATEVRSTRASAGHAAAVFLCG
eukprot:356061-Chlamydomonas_euryale.AAC.2